MLALRCEQGCERTADLPPEALERWRTPKSWRTLVKSWCDE